MYEFHFFGVFSQENLSQPRFTLVRFSSLVGAFPFLQPFQIEVYFGKSMSYFESQVKYFQDFRTDP